MIDFIDEIELLDRSKSVKDLTDKELIFDHALLHHFFKLIKKGEEVKKWNLEDVVNQHKLVVQEMISRGFKHRITDPDLDKFEIKADNQSVNELQSLKERLPDEILLTKNFVSFVGSCLNKVEPNDVDILYRFVPVSFSELGSEEIVKQIDELQTHFLFSEWGPQGPSLALYDLKLVKSSDNIVDFDYELSLDRPFNREELIPLPVERSIEFPAYLSPEVRGIEIQILRDGDEIFIFADGEALECRDLERAIESIEDPTKFIMIGFLRSDRKIVISDLLHWRETQLINLPIRERRALLKKFKLEDPLILLPMILIDQRRNDEIIKSMSELAGDWGEFFVLRSSEDPYQEEIAVERIKLGDR